MIPERLTNNHDSALPAIFNTHVGNHWFVVLLESTGDCYLLGSRKAGGSSTAFCSRLFSAVCSAKWLDHICSYIDLYCQLLVRKFDNFRRGWLRWLIKLLKHGLPTKRVWKRTVNRQLLMVLDMREKAHMESVSFLWCYSEPACAKHTKVEQTSLQRDLVFQRFNGTCSAPLLITNLTRAEWHGGLKLECKNLV